MRVVDRVLAGLLGLLLLAGGLLAAVEVGVAALDWDPWVIPHDRWRRTALDTRWDDRSVLWVAIAVGAVGAIIVLAELRRRTPVEIPLADGPHTGTIHRSSAERSLSRRIEHLDGIRMARAKLRPRRVTIVARTSRHDHTELRTRLEAAATSEVGRLGLAAEPRVTTRLRGDGGG